MKIKVLLGGCILAISAVNAQEMARGVVYHDVNRNGIKDKTEIGISTVSVSNGREVVQTNSNGEYELPVGNDNIIFVIKPGGFSFPLNDKNLPQFYYAHKPQGAPKLKYTTFSATGKLPKRIDFPMYKKEESNSFKALIFGDPQAYNLDEIAYFQKGIIDDVERNNDIAFGISLGDLVGDDLVLHKPYQDAIQKIGKPWYNVIGNHDMNFDVKSDSLSDETFEYHFGPANYSFNYGNAHFIVLDNIIYPNPRTGKGYLGGFRKDQLDFIENNLKFVPKDKLIVLNFHIPLAHKNSDVFRDEDRQRLFDILASYQYTVSMSAHTHYQKQIFYGKEEGWRQETPHHEYNVGTTSGDWYSGTFNAKGVPNSTMRDGTPRGYAILNVDGNKYSFNYKVAGESKAYQIKIIAPKVIDKKHIKRYKISANFFLGKKGDKVQFRIGNQDWKDMSYVEAADPSYQYEVLKFDNAENYIQGRRPSTPVNSSHLWEAKFPNSLEIGKHELEVRAIDMYGNTHQQLTSLEILK